MTRLVRTRTRAGTRTQGVGGTFVTFRAQPSGLAGLIRVARPGTDGGSRSEPVRRRGFATPVDSQPRYTGRGKAASSDGLAMPPAVRVGRRAAQ